MLCFTIFVFQHKILGREWMKCSVLQYSYFNIKYTDVYTIMHILQIAFPLFKLDIKVQFVQSIGCCDIDKYGKGVVSRQINKDETCMSFDKFLK